LLRLVAFSGLAFVVEHGLAEGTVVGGRVVLDAVVVVEGVHWERKERDIYFLEDCGSVGERQ